MPKLENLNSWNEARSLASLLYRQYTKNREFYHHLGDLHEVGLPDYDTMTKKIARIDRGAESKREAVDDLARYLLTYSDSH